MAGTTPPFQHMSTVTATVKRPPVISGGKRGAPVTVGGVSLKIFPLMPLDAQVRLTIPLDTPHTLLQTFTEGSSINITEGDLLVVSGVEYPVKRIGKWPYGGIYYYDIIVEDLET